MSDQNILHEFLISEFRGDFPQVPVDARVDLAALTGGEDAPFFVTMPVARLGETSLNGLVYDEGLVRAIETQVIGKGGIMGHMKVEDRTTAFPVDDVDWVGVQRVGDTTWAKAYLPPGKAREFVRRLKARGGKLATSIYGKHGGRETLKDGKWRAKAFQLEQLDLAAADRAALQLGGQFGITAEMEQDQQETEMDKQERLAELTASEIPQTLRDQIVAEYQAANKTGEQIAELQTQVEDRDGIISELKTQLEQVRVREFDAAITGIVSEFVTFDVKKDEDKKKVDSLRRMFRGTLLAELGDERDPAKAKETAKKIWESEFQVIAETVRDALAGPAALVSGKVRDGGRPELVDTPENRAKAFSRLGISI